MDMQERIFNKLDKIEDKLDSQNSILMVQQTLLDEHIRRTELAEENIRLLRKELKPVQDHVVMMQSGLKMIGLIGIILTIGVSALEIVNILK